MPAPLRTLAATLAGVAPDAVELAETHISRVALAGPPGAGVALKQCKAVDFGFVDLSTPEARRAALGKEKTVNDRFAPGVYRGVRDLPGGEPVLEMRRLDAADTLDAKVRRGGATAADLDAVLDHLLPLFADSERTPAWGDPAVMRRNLVENLDVLDAAERRFGCDLSAAALRSEQLTCLALLEPALHRRASDGFVRDGHGDLRCEHVYLTGDGVKVLDGIAWSDRLRCVDVADEVCFLASDLDRVAAERAGTLGRPGTIDDAPAGSDLLSSYRNGSGDDVSADLVAFYRSYRLAVRAKVAALSAGDDPGRWRPALRQVGDLASLATKTGLGMETGSMLGGPVAVVFGGLSGSGKSTLARAVAERIGCSHLRTDELRKELLGLAPSDTAAPEAYELAGISAVYDALLARCVGALDDMRGVVVDGTFVSPDIRRRFVDCLSDAAFSFQFVWCECDDAVAEARLAARAAAGTDASDADVGVRRRQAVGLGGDGGDAFSEFTHVLRLDTDAPVDALCDRVIDALRVAAGTHPQ